MSQLNKSFFKPQSDLRWTEKQAQRALASGKQKKYSKGFAKVSAGTNDLSIMDLTRETTNQKCTGTKSAQHVCIRCSLRHNRNFT